MIHSSLHPLPSLLPRLAVHKRHQLGHPEAEGERQASRAQEDLVANEEQEDANKGLRREYRVDQRDLKESSVYLSLIVKNSH